MTGDVPRGVVVVGSLNVDVTATARRLPGRGETVPGDHLSIVLGGKGANQAVAAARAGASTAMVGRVGTDAFAGVVLDGLRADGVDATDVAPVPGGTGVAHIRVDAAGENDIVVVAQANAALAPPDAEAALRRLAPTSAVVLLQLEVPVATVAHAARVAHELGLTVVLDPAPAVPLPDSIWADVDVVTPNETEAALVTGEPAAEGAARWFVQRGAGAAVVTLGPAGVVVAGGGPEGALRRLPAVPVDAADVVDTTAAGDAFSGTLGAALAAGATLDDAVRRALAAGSLAVRTAGATPSLPTAAAVDAVLANLTSNG